MKKLKKIKLKELDSLTKEEIGEIKGGYDFGVRDGNVGGSVNITPGGISGGGVSYYF